MHSSKRVEMDWKSSGRSGHTAVDEGSLLFLPPGTYDSLNWHGPAQPIVVSIDPLLLKQMADQMELRGLPEFTNLWSFKDEQIRLLLSEMKREMSTGWAMGSLYGDTLSASLSIVLIKKYGQPASQQPPLKGGLSRHRLRRVLEYIDAGLHRDIHLQELAALAGLSPFHFMRSFRQSMGSTPHQYLTELRIRRAKSLLLQSRFSILDVALAVGFADASQFSKVFKKSTGASPAVWRREA
jgi:AraC family transcriptional regulator